MLESIKKTDKKIIIMAGMVLGIILLIIIAIVVMSFSKGGSISFSKIEKKLVTAAEKYYKDNEDSLPKKVGDTVEIDSDELVSGGYIKDLTEYTKEGVVCSAKVLVGKHETGYDYVTALDCGDDYKTVFLADKLIEEATVTSGAGLYKMDEVVEYGTTLGMDEDGYDLSSNELMAGYIYRGENPNNYVKFSKDVSEDKTLYRIIKIDGNKDITLMSTNKKIKESFDSNYNSEANQKYGVYDYKNTNAYNSLKEYYDEKVDEYVKTKVTNKNICIGARSVDETSTDGSVECSVVVKDQLYSLVPVFDIMNASLSENCDTTISKECQNYNYIIKNFKTWSLTPSTENSYSAFKVKNGLATAKLSDSNTLGYVYYISNRVTFVSGTGTEKDPFIIK